MNHKHGELEYCLTYYNKFPDDIQTARHFIMCRFAENALDVTEDDDEILKIELCKKEAIKLIEKFNTKQANI